MIRALMYTEAIVKKHAALIEMIYCYDDGRKLKRKIKTT
jgi:hypothetical protein